MGNKNKPKNKGHLPLYGVGPAYVFVILVCTFCAVLARNLKVFSAGSMAALRLPLALAGVPLIALGAFIFIHALVFSRLQDGIKANRLVTTGVYAWVRNPLYSAYLIMTTGVILIVANAFFFVLPFIYWLMLTLLMKRTEERWLRELYGREYDDYCRRVNRCIPWFPKKPR